ncbi:MAG: hypothetical protein GY826_07885, partial [Fuerstiella sp.]|nr:hypothetical protein [Fuerstiella sp.]
MMTISKARRQQSCLLGLARTMRSELREAPFSSAIMCVAPTTSETRLHSAIATNGSTTSATTSTASCTGNVISHTSFVAESRYNSRVFAQPFSVVPLPRGSLSGLKLRKVADNRGGTTGDGMTSMMSLQIMAIGVNFRDVLNVLGMYPGDPGVPGSDVSGIVSSVSSTISLPTKSSAAALHIGDAVYGLLMGCMGSGITATT